VASLADPKDKLRVFEGVQQAGELILRDDPAAAARTLEAALVEDPDMPQALLMLGSVYSELGRSREAKAQFDRVLKADAQNVQALVGMASVLVKEGKTGEVRSSRSASGRSRSTTATPRPTRCSARCIRARRSRPRPCRTSRRPSRRSRS
jgi:thioredoxin-like negative regulator of GroEL